MAVGMPPELPIPPDSYAAHLAELPVPGSQVFDARDALALALMYNCMDPDKQKELQNLREDVRALSDQNQNLNAYAQMIYIIANKLRAQLATVMEHNAKVEAELTKLKDNELSTTSHLQLRDANTALESERDSLREKVNALELRLQSTSAYDSDVEVLPQSDIEDEAAATLQGTPTFGTAAPQLYGHPPVDSADGEDMPADPKEKRKIRNRLAARRHRERKAQLARQNEQRIVALTKQVGELRAQLAAQAAPAPEEQGSIDVERLRLQTTLAIERRRHADELRAVVQDQERLRALSGAEKEKRVALESERDNAVGQLVAQRADQTQVAQERDRVRSELDASQTLVKKLEVELARTMQETDGLRGELRAAEQTARDFESKIAAAQAAAAQQLDELRRTGGTQSATIVQERDQLRAELAAVRKAADARNAQLQASLRESKKLNDDATSLRDRIADLETKLQKAEQAAQDATAEATRLPQVVSERDALASEIEGLRAKMESRRNVEPSVQTLTENVDRLTGKLNKSLGELADTAKQLQEREAELATLSAERTRWTDKTNDLQAKLEQAQTELDKRQKQLSTLQTSTHHWKTQYDIACRQHAEKLSELGKTLSAAREQLDRTGTELRVERERSQSERTQFKAQLESARKTSSVWQSKYDTAAKTLSTSKTEVEKKLATECAQLRKVVTSLRAESSALQEKLSAALLEIKKKESNFADLCYYRAHSKNLQDTVNEQKQKVVELEKLLEAGKKGCEDIIQKYDDLRTTARRLEDKLALTTGDQMRASRKVHTLECSLKDATAEVAALKSQVAEMTEALQKERTRPGSQREIDELRAENDRLCEQIDELEKANARLTLDARGPSGTV